MKNEQNKQNDLELLRELYLADLSKMVRYGHLPERSRVRYPGKWAKLEARFRLNEKWDDHLTIPTNDDRQVWIWSDQHFFHKNIIDFSNRPYTNTHEMNENLIANFNDCVGENDISIWVGDVGFKGTTFINELLEQCNGYKILVVGNHDFDGKKVRHLNFDETHLLYTINTPEVDLVLTHYPMYNIPSPLINIHGHLHAYPNPISNHERHYNVCCEIHGYKPVNLNEIISVAKTIKISAEL